MAKRPSARNPDAAGLRRILVRQRNLTLERTADRGHTQLHLHLVGVGRDLGHGLAPGNAARQHGRIVERLPERLDRSLYRLDAAAIELHTDTLFTVRTDAAPDRH